VSQLTRRTFLTGAAALAAVGSLPASAQAQSYSGILVDVNYLRSLGAGPTADVVQRVIGTELLRLYAGRLQRGGPELVIRVRTVQLASVFGYEGRNASDYMEGDLLLVGPRGEVLRQVPQVLAVPAGYSTSVGDEQRRLVTLAQTFAAWVPRRI
jgi:hypothetical protein